MARANVQDEVDMVAERDSIHGRSLQPQLSYGRQLHHRVCLGLSSLLLNPEMLTAHILW
jgi:hypothetical protein